MAVQIYGDATRWPFSNFARARNLVKIDAFSSDDDDDAYDADDGQKEVRWERKGERGRERGGFGQPGNEHHGQPAAAMAIGRGGGGGGGWERPDADGLRTATKGRRRC